MSQQKSNKTVLLIDDCKNIGISLGYAIRRAGYKVVYLNSPEEVITDINPIERFYAIISDWHISDDYKANNVLEFIATSGINKNIPFAIITTDYCITNSYYNHYKVILKSANTAADVLAWLEEIGNTSSSQP